MFVQIRERDEGWELVGEKGEMRERREWEERGQTMDLEMILLIRIYFTS